MKPLFTETDPYTGVVSEYLTDGKTLVERTTVDPIATQATLDHATRLANDTDYTRAGIKKGWWHAATIPAEVWLRWKNEGFDIFTANTSEVMKKLRDPDYARLRTTHAKF